MMPGVEESLKTARDLIEANKHDEARICLLELLEKEQDNRLALIMLGGNYFTMGKYSEAEMIFERLILLEPGKGQYSVALFNTLWKMQRHEEALEEIKRFMAVADKVEEKETIAQYLAITKKFSS